MTATFESIIKAAMLLSPQDRFLVASRLWESAESPPASYEEEALEHELASRDKELDENPSLEVTHESFLAHFANRRR
jgi:putative addiction module component (TIGR02574 family)